MLRQLPILVVLLLCGSLCADDAERAAFFEAKIRPVLIEHCYECHASDAEKIGGELLLDSRDSMRRGGESGAALELGDADGSLIMEALRYESYEMPPTKKLPDRVIADFAHWINDGAFDPREEASRPSASPAAKSEIDIEAGREFWAFQNPLDCELPEVGLASWPKRDADYFVLAKLESQGFQPNGEADRRTLIRRVTFDLTGLPPTPDEVVAFLADDQPGAYARVVERLLASPQMGARWARLWLDVARYAEDQAHIVGNNKSLFYPNAWKYRDWLIDAMNSDMPYDQFVLLQLAADLVGEEGQDHLVAMGFLGLGPKYYRRNAPEVMADEWEDRVDTVTRGLQGITVACARCHDHKYDPITTRDYYALAGVFASTAMHNRPFDDWQATEEKKKPDPVDTLHILKDQKPRDLKVHIRGDAFNEGELVPRRYLEVLSRDEVSLQEGSGRLPLANAIASPDNPLTARVIVNRIWREYFGRGLVATPSNFGKLGQRPSHPEMLDDLAVRFMNAGWSLKWLHREIVLSATYRQSSDASQAVIDVDPENRLLGRQTRRRLSVEMWRDAMLSVAGKLNEQVGGESLDVQDLKSLRRSVYAKVSRLELDSMLQMFDFPDPNVHAANRSETTTPLQKLFTLNSPFIVRRADELAARIMSYDGNVDGQTTEQQTTEHQTTEHQTTEQQATEQQAAETDGNASGNGSDSALQARIRRAYALLFAREPSEVELTLGEQFIGGGADSSRWQQYAQILLASNEMLFLD